jgi:hypothetical protein
MKPTAEQLLDEDGLKSVHREADDSWRHGCYISEVFHRNSDNTYWMVNYRLSHDGETNGLRDGDYSLDQVEPFEKTVTDYRKVEAEKPAQVA